MTKRQSFLPSDEWLWKMDSTILPQTWKKKKTVLVLSKTFCCSYCLCVWYQTDQLLCLFLLEWDLHPPLLLPTAGLEGHLQYTVAKGKPVEILNSHESLLVVGHGDEAKPFALARGVVADDLDTLHCPKWPKELPEDGVLCVWGQVVDKDAPPSTVERGRSAGGVGGSSSGCGQCRRQDGIGQNAWFQGWVPVSQMQTATDTTSAHVITATYTYDCILSTMSLDLHHEASTVSLTSTVHFFIQRLHNTNMTQDLAESQTQPSSNLW